MCIRDRCIHFFTINVRRGISFLASPAFLSASSFSASDSFSRVLWALPRVACHTAVLVWQVQMSLKNFAIDKCFDLIWFDLFFWFDLIGFYVFAKFFKERRDRESFRPQCHDGTENRSDLNAKAIGTTGQRIVETSMPRQLRSCGCSDIRSVSLHKKITIWTKESSCMWFFHRTQLPIRVKAAGRQSEHLLCLCARIHLCVFVLVHIIVCMCIQCDTARWAVNARGFVNHAH